MEALLGFFTPLIIYFITFLLNAILPGRWVIGYATDQHNNKLKYRLNGMLVLLTSLSIWAGLCYSDLISWTWLYEIRYYGLLGAITFGLLFSLVIVLPYEKVKNSFLADFYLGRLENPQLWGGRVDAKMWLYLIGAILLELNVLSYAAFHYFEFGAAASPGIFIGAGLITYFVFDYLTFEEIHLYTYDLFAERVGFKLGWGCIAFYPYFYTITLWNTAALENPEWPWYYYLVSVLIFFTGWGLSRGANMQKYFFKRNPDKIFLGIKPEKLIDGEKMLLANGFWGLSRHINYLGEILMATGIALSVGHPTQIWPWLYPLYYVILLFPRQIDDDKRCAEKYGSLWDQYLEKVPNRIIPGIY